MMEERGAVGDAAALFVDNRLVNPEVTSSVYE
jgi:hypothetical protein